MLINIDTGLCPRCESNKTGRYIYRPIRSGTSILEKKNHKNNIRIRYIDIPIQDLGYNLYYESCGANYCGNIRYTFNIHNMFKNVFSKLSL